MAYVDGKVAALTGAGSGIGRALALQLNNDGCELFLSDISAASLNETLALLPRQEVPAAGQVLDVADKPSVYAWAEKIAEAKGHVDIVINNAGVALISNAEDNRHEDFEWLMGVNFWGVVYGTQAFLPLLRQSQQGHLVNISSVFGLFSVPTQSAYNASKFAVRGYTEALRQEMEGSNVHVCCVHPGGIKTNIARAARSEDSDINADKRDTEFQKLARTSPKKAAATIIAAIEKRKKRALIGMDARFFSLMCRLFPVRYPRILALLDRNASESLK